MMAEQSSSPCEVKRFLRNLLCLLLIYLSSLFGIILTKSKSWRVWEFDSKSIPTMFFGLWEVYYTQKMNISGVPFEIQLEYRMNESWAISKEIICRQEMILSANFMKFVVLAYSTLAFWVNYTKAPYPDFVQVCYNICIVFLLLSSGCTTVAVIWNFTEDFSGKATFDFPPNFPIGKESLKRRKHSYVFPLGITTGSLSILSALNFCYEQFLLKTMVKKPKYYYQKIKIYIA